jgi:hypothetical protein
MFGRVPYDNNFVQVWQSIQSTQGVNQYLQILQISLSVSVDHQVFCMFACSCSEERLQVFENKVLRNLLGPKIQLSGHLRILYNKELHDLYRSPTTVRIIKSQRLEWTKHMTQNEET